MGKTCAAVVGLVCSKVFVTQQQDLCSRSSRRLTHSGSACRIEHETHGGWAGRATGKWQSDVLKQQQHPANPARSLCT